MSFKLGVRRDIPMKAFSTLRMRYACPSASSQAVMSKLSRPSGLNTLSCKIMQPSVKPEPLKHLAFAANQHKHTKVKGPVIFADLATPTAGYWKPGVSRWNSITYCWVAAENRICTHVCCRAAQGCVRVGKP